MRITDLPDQNKWQDFIANLLSLQRRGTLSFVVGIEADTLTANIKLAENSRDLTDPSPGWRPSHSTVSRLSMYGLHKREIERLTLEYTTQAREPFDDTRFARFALDSSSEPINLLLIPQDWQPSAATREIVRDLGVADAVYTNYLQDFIRSGAKFSASWDDAFCGYCKLRWESDNRNPHAAKATLMSSDWKPTQKTMSELERFDGIDRNDLELMFLEYRLYWIERGEARANWDAHFKWWARTRKKPQAQ